MRGRSGNLFISHFELVLSYVAENSRVEDLDTYSRFPINPFVNTVSRHILGICPLKLVSLSIRSPSENTRSFVSSLSFFPCILIGTGIPVTISPYCFYSHCLDCSTTDTHCVKTRLFYFHICFKYIAPNFTLTASTLTSLLIELCPD